MGTVVETGIAIYLYLRHMSLSLCLSMSLSVLVLNAKIWREIRRLFGWTGSDDRVANGGDSGPAHAL